MASPLKSKTNLRNSFITRTNTIQRKSTNQRDEEASMSLSLMENHSSNKRRMLTGNHILLIYRKDFTSTMMNETEWAISLTALKLSQLKASKAKNKRKLIRKRSNHN